MGLQGRGRRLQGKVGRLPSHVGLYREEFTKRRENRAFSIKNNWNY
jgi:hypothetical protein